MKALDRKLRRDLSRMKGQAITIGLVMACGIASFIALQGNYSSLLHARDLFYERNRFPHVFANLERAPLDAQRQLETIPGVARAQVRVVSAGTVRIAGEPEPLRAAVISLTSGDAEPLDALRLWAGRRPEPRHRDEAILHEGFATTHHLSLGDTLPVVLEGAERRLRIVGIAVSPEHVLPVSPGGQADPARFAVLWMDGETLRTFSNREGAFNYVELALQPGASEAAVIAETDRILTPYGGLGAFGRSRQPSNHVLDGELAQLRGLSTILPTLFLGVAAMLFNVVLTRIIFLQRPEIATLKAVGYSGVSVGVHFLKLVLLISFGGALLGVSFGSWFGGKMVALYAKFFRFPDLALRLDLGEIARAAGISFTAAVAGALFAVFRAVRLPPAEAMRPPTPLKYVRSTLDRLGLAKWLGPSVQMVVRELERRPLRAMLSCVAISAATGLTIVGAWYYDGIEALMRIQFHEILREDLTVTFHHPRPERVLRELAHIPGVLSAEGLRAVPVRVRANHRKREANLLGYAEGMQMRQVRDAFGREVPLPPQGMVLTKKLADILDVSPGDTVEVEMLEGDRERKRAPVSGIVDESFGLQAHMRLGTLRSWLKEPPAVSLALLRVDPFALSSVMTKLKDSGQVAEVLQRRSVLERFRKQSGEMLILSAIVLTIFAIIITVGVVYNNARVALSLRGRDLASLRVLGFTRGEISSVLIGESAVQVLVALPFGLWFGRVLVGMLAHSANSETWRMPIILPERTYAFAATVTLLAALGSALLVRRKLDRLDLIGVLKTRE